MWIDKQLFPDGVVYQMTCMQPEQLARQKCIVYDDSNDAGVYWGSLSMNGPQQTACFAKGMHNYTLFYLKNTHFSLTC